MGHLLNQVLHQICTLKNPKMIDLMLSLGKFFWLSVLQCKTAKYWCVMRDMLVFHWLSLERLSKSFLFCPTLRHSNLAFILVLKTVHDTIIPRKELFTHPVITEDR